MRYKGGGIKLPCARVARGFFARRRRDVDCKSLHLHVCPEIATVRPPSLLNHSRRLASCRAPRHCRLSTPAASSDFFCVLPFGGRANGRVSTPRPTRPLQRRRPRRRVRRLRRLRPALPASSAHVRRDVQLGIRRRLRRRWPRLGFRPARADSMCVGPDHRIMWQKKVTVVCT